MSPDTILSTLDQAKLESMIQDFNSGQFKAVLRAGGLQTKVPSACVLQKARRRIWSRRILDGIKENRQGIAGELIYQWLLNHRRQMLVDYLNALGVKHVRGETEETFTKTIPEENLINEAVKLMERYEPRDVAIYTLFLDYHQESGVYTGNPRIGSALKTGNAGEAVQQAEQ